MCNEKLTNRQAEPSFETFNNALVDESELFAATLESLAQFSHKRSETLLHPGLVDSKLQIGCVMANQVYGECQHYYLNNPSSVEDAACWLQKAFVLCRVFESEQHGENKQVSPHVGNMCDQKTGKKFGELTAMSKLTTDPHAYGTEHLNRELQELINIALAECRPLDAIRLLCDSPKHGVLSSIVNLLFFKAPQQVYMIGLWAARIAIEGWLERNATG